MRLPRMYTEAGTLSEIHAFYGLELATAVKIKASQLTLRSLKLLAWIGQLDYSEHCRLPAGGLRLTDAEKMLLAADEKLTTRDCRRRVRTLAELVF